jgi:hypothetical protein
LAAYLVKSRIEERKLPMTGFHADVTDDFLLKRLGIRDGDLQWERGTMIFGGFRGEAILLE